MKEMNVIEFLEFVGSRPFDQVIEDADKEELKHLLKIYALEQDCEFMDFKQRLWYYIKYHLGLMKRPNPIDYKDHME